MTLLRISSPVAGLKNGFLEDVISKSKYLTRSFNNKNKKSAHSSPLKKKVILFQKLKKLPFLTLYLKITVVDFFIYYAEVF